jgi:serine/threonine protein kinase
MQAPKERKFVAQRQQGIDRSKAAKLFIHTYYKNLVEQVDERQERLEKLKEETVGLSASEQEKAQQALAQDESQHMRLQRTKLSVRDFEHIKLIGRGAFGEVRIVRSKFDTDNKRVLAMKIINKDFMIQKNQLAHARAERDAMVEFENIWVVKLFYSFQDAHFLYFVMEYLPGGDMMNLLINKTTLNEHEARFYFMELILAINSVHAHGYIHRDLKPDNILIDARGHIKLSDFGLCTSGTESHLSSFYQTVVPKEFDSEYDKNKLQVIHQEREKTKMEKQRSWDRKRKTLSYSTVGTSNYMAPEILLQTGYTSSVDWWSFGIIAYECLVGYAPFSCEDTADTCMLILNHKESLEFPSYEEVPLSEGVLDLLSKLICDANERYDFQKLKAHYWFKGHEWEKIQEKSSPWIPELSSDIDTKNFDELEDNSSDFIFPRDDVQKPLKDLGKDQLPFVGWTYKRFEKKTKPNMDTIFTNQLQPDQTKEERNGSLSPKDTKDRLHERPESKLKGSKSNEELMEKRKNYETVLIHQSKEKKDKSPSARSDGQLKSQTEPKIPSVVPLLDMTDSPTRKSKEKEKDKESSGSSGSKSRRHSHAGTGDKPEKSGKSDAERSKMKSSGKVKEAKEGDEKK